MSYCRPPFGAHFHQKSSDYFASVTILGGHMLPPDWLVVNHFSGLKRQQGGNTCQEYSEKVVGRQNGEGILFVRESFLSWGTSYQRGAIWLWFLQRFLERSLEEQVWETGGEIFFQRYLGGKAGEMKKRVFYQGK